MAVDVRYVGTRGRQPVVHRSTTTARDDREATASSTSSSSAMAEPRRPTTPSGVTTRARVVRLLRPRHRHQPAADLPRVPERPDQRGRPGRLHRRHATWANSAITAGPRPRLARPVRVGRRSRRQPDAPEQRASRPACRRTSSSSIPTPTTSTSPTAARSATTTRCRSSCGAGCRGASRRTSTTSTRSSAARAFDGFSYGRDLHGRRAERPARDQDPVGLDAAGRPRPALRRQHAPGAATACSAAGASTASAACRRRDCVDFGNVRLVGMTTDDLQEIYKHEIRINPGQRARRRSTCCPTTSS